MPSRLVPDIKPAYSSGGCCTKWSARYSHSETASLSPACGREGNEHGGYCMGGISPCPLVEFCEVGVAQQIQARDKTVCHRLKCRFIRIADWLRVRQGDAQRVALLAVDSELIVQMRPAGQTGHADIADHLPLCHALATAQSLGETRQMAIHRSKAPLMIDQDDVAITTLPAER